MLYQRYFLRMNQSNMTCLLALLLAITLVMTAVQTTLLIVAKRSHDAHIERMAKSGYLNPPPAPVYNATATPPLVDADGKVSVPPPVEPAYNYEDIRKAEEILQKEYIRERNGKIVMLTACTVTTAVYLSKNYLFFAEFIMSFILISSSVVLPYMGKWRRVRRSYTLSHLGHTFFFSINLSMRCVIIGYVNS